MSQPIRIQLSRRRGFKLQEVSRAANGLPCVNVARPGPWGNPFKVGRDGTRERCVELLRHLCSGRICLTCKAPVADQEAWVQHAQKNIGDLRGKNLACWCKIGESCHADLLLEIAHEGNETC